MKRSVRTTILTLAIVSLIMICMTTLSFAGGFGVGVDMPENLSVSNVASGINLTWNESPDVDGYRVYRRQLNQSHPVEIAKIAGADKTTYTDKTARNGEKYEYSVRAYNGVFFSRLSGCAEIVKLSQPSLKSVSAGNACIEIKWEKSDGAQGYYVYRKNAQGIDFIAEIKGDNTCLYEDKNVVEGKVYTYTVTAFKDEYRSSHEFKSSLPYVASPEIISVKNTGDSVTVKWQKSKTADNFIVYRKVNNEKNWVKLKTLSANKNSFKDTDVKNSDTYTYTVKAISKNIYSGYNKAGVSIQFLNAPQNLKVKNYNDGILLSWEAVKGAQGYNVYRSFEGKTRLVGQTSETSYSDMKVDDGKEYKYTVKSVGFASAMLSSKSEAAECFVIKKPLNIAVVNLYDGIQVYWQKSDYATGYTVYRKLYGETKWTELKKIKSRKTNYIIDKDVKKDSTYIYSVRCEKDGTSGSFDINGVTIRHIPSLGAKAELCPKGIRITWTDVPNCSGYELFRKTDDGQDWVKIGSFEYGQTGCIDINPVYGKKNSYVVRVIFADGGAYDSSVSSAYGIDPDKPMVALTYDDGPSDTVTNRILDKLQEYNGRATFFVVGERVRVYRDSIRRAVSLDCEIGNHSYHHKDLEDSTAQEIKEELNSTNSVVESVTGVVPVIARAPGGAMDDLVRETAGMPFIYWSIDTLDWKYRNKKSVTDAVKSQVRDGSIVLMHDLYDSTADASDVLIPWLIENGYQLVTVSEMMAVKGIEMKDGETYING